MRYEGGNVPSPPGSGRKINQEPKMEANMIVLDPRQRSNVSRVAPAKRVKSLKNIRLGILWNNRPGGDRILNGVADLLNQKYHFAEIYFTKKMFIGNAAPPEIIDDLASRVDAAVVGLGD